MSVRLSLFLLAFVICWIVHTAKDDTSLYLGAVKVLQINYKRILYCMEQSQGDAVANTDAIIDPALDHFTTATDNADDTLRPFVFILNTVSKCLLRREDKDHELSSVMVKTLKHRSEIK